mgnify:FL=1|tara:strand:+ start:109 stop:261 length:153 start_codon:yes stop_codon:yes gene_type:complete
MDYLDFVVEIVREGMKLTRAQMQFAYTVGFNGMNMEPIEAAQMSLDLDRM